MTGSGNNNRKQKVEGTRIENYYSNSLLLEYYSSIRVLATALDPAQQPSAGESHVVPAIT